MSMRQSLRLLRTPPIPSSLPTRRFLATATATTASKMSAPGSSSAETHGPIEQAIREKITTKFAPTRLEVHNDSHLHRHHRAMEGSTSAETHFRLVIASGEFRDKTQVRRHRLVNELLREDLAREGGIHALQLRTMTPEEDERRREGGK